MDHSPNIWVSLSEKLSAQEIAAIIISAEQRAVAEIGNHILVLEIILAVLAVALSLIGWWGWKNIKEAAIEASISRSKDELQQFLGRMRESQTEEIRTIATESAIRVMVNYLPNPILEEADNRQESDKENQDD